MIWQHLLDLQLLKRTNLIQFPIDLWCFNYGFRVRAALWTCASASGLKDRLYGLSDKSSNHASPADTRPDTCRHKPPMKIFLPTAFATLILDFKMLALLERTVDQRIPSNTGKISEIGSLRR